MKDIFFEQQAKRKTFRKALLYLIEVWFEMIRFEQKTLAIETYIDELKEKFPELSMDKLLTVKISIGSFVDIADSLFSEDDEVEDKLFNETLSKIAEGDPILAFELESQVLNFDYLTLLHRSYKEIIKAEDWNRMNEFLNLISASELKNNIISLEQNIILVAGKIGLITKKRTRELLSGGREKSREQFKKIVSQVIQSVAFAVKSKNGA
ncbi:hypothetical protein EHQ81_19395 [Leptospira selangorensis]|uniref:Uncharacterized protein n=1 Tax=Leptospira selangorensis TaxID=2484982 RepID=A0A5F2C6F0_9LEPT|nr:hypothetical protein [Leptospira selangorensis]TGM10274.1 hypothetical protein EHQ81_19395 [Leptospira selangorensis]TGM27936.1 hypothetical protein EHQ82_01575 [Leptospira selangorensis]